MPKEEREEQILRFMAEYDLALPLRPLFHNLKEKEGITFSRRTLKRRLEDLVDAGDLEQLDIGNGYYRITEAGRRRVNQEGDSSR